MNTRIHGIRSSLGFLRRLGILGAALGCAALPAIGCVPVEAGFACSSNDKCVTQEGQQGICEVTGYCGFPDSACEGTGRRHGAAAPADLADQCVAPPAEVGCIAQISAGGMHTCVLKKDGTVWCWGSNQLGQLGATGATASGPVRVEALAGKEIVEISAGIEHTCALTAGGDVYCWGGNEDGQLGVVDSMGAKVEGGETPRRVEGMPVVKTLSAGGKHTCAVDEDSHVWCFGENLKGQLADGTLVERPSPVQVTGVEKAKLVRNGDEHTCVLQDGGALICWGSNELGQIGTGDPGAKGVPPTEVPGLLSIEDLGVGDEHTCVRKGGGPVSCWGHNGKASVGNGQIKDQATPVDVFAAARIALSGGAFHSCAIVDMEVGELWCWGQNDQGQIGNGTITIDAKKGALVPVRAALVTAVDAAVGGAHTCAITKDETLWCWGDNAAKQLGGGSNEGRSSLPVRVPICP